MLLLRSMEGDKDKDIYKDMDIDYIAIKKEKQKKKEMKIEKSRRRNELLSKSTDAESSVCRMLDGMGIRYIRQFPIYTGRKKYYADVYIPGMRLIIELDGGYHYTAQQKRRDANRSAGIRRLGYHVCRINNRDAYTIKVLLSKLRRFLAR